MKRVLPMFTLHALILIAAGVQYARCSRASGFLSIWQLFLYFPSLCIWGWLTWHLLQVVLLLSKNIKKLYLLKEILYLYVAEEPLNGKTWKRRCLDKCQVFYWHLIVFWQYFLSPDDCLLITAFVIQSARQLQHSRLPEWKYYIRWWKNVSSV